jgi:hypothetical protein
LSDLPENAARDALQIESLTDLMVNAFHANATIRAAYDSGGEDQRRLFEAPREGLRRGRKKIISIRTNGIRQFDEERRPMSKKSTILKRLDDL